MTTTLPLRLNIAAIELPYMPRGDQVTVTPVRAIETYTLLDGSVGVQYGPVTSTTFEIDGQENMLDLDTMLALKALWKSYAPFVLIETFSDPTQTMTWMGARFTEAPKMPEIHGSNRQFYTYNFKIETGGAP